MRHIMISFINDLQNVVIRSYYENYYIEYQDYFTFIMVASIKLNWLEGMRVGGKSELHELCLVQLTLSEFV